MLGSIISYYEQRGTSFDCANVHKICRIMSAFAGSLPTTGGVLKEDAGSLKANFKDICSGNEENSSKTQMIPPTKTATKKDKTQRQKGASIKG